MSSDESDTVHFALGAVEIHEEVAEAVYCTGPLSSACFSHASGGCGTATVHDECYSKSHTEVVMCALKDYLTHSDLPSDLVAESDADVSVDGE